MDLEEFHLTEADFPVCLFSDLHADIEHLEQLFHEVSAAKRFFCVGDFVDFRESIQRNSAAVALCQERGLSGVRGNHDDYACALNSVLASDEQEFLWNLPDAMVLQVPFGRVGLFHSSPSGNVAFFNAVEMKQFLLMFQDLCLTHVFVGHTHTAYTIDLEGMQLTNLGHLGRAGVGDPYCSYGLLHVDGRFERKRLLLQ